MDDRKLGGFGWCKDQPDIRDFNLDSIQIKNILVKSGPLQVATVKRPEKVDLRQWCSPIEDQQDIGSCVAHSCVGLLEFYQRRAFGHHLDLSRLFVYKVARNLLGWKGDTGAYLRTGMQAMTLFGAPLEKYYPYKVSKFDDEPAAFQYAIAGNYKAVKYYRLDKPGLSKKDTLEAILTSLAAGLPCMFGFTVYSSIPSIGDGKDLIPFPQKGDTVEGGHAVMAVGYDEKSYGGSLLIRNSWSKEWGQNGYGYLPFQYILHGLADDFWSLVQADFVDTDLFK